MSWTEFAWAGAAIGLWVWGSRWKLKAERLQHERNIYRRLARGAQPRPTRAIEKLYDQGSR